MCCFRELINGGVVRCSQKQYAVMLLFKVLFYSPFAHIPHQFSIYDIFQIINEWYHHASYLFILTFVMEGLWDKIASVMKHYSSFRHLFPDEPFLGWKKNSISYLTRKPECAKLSTLKTLQWQKTVTKAWHWWLLLNMLTMLSILTDSFSRSTIIGFSFLNNN